MSWESLQSSSPKIIIISDTSWSGVDSVGLTWGRRSRFLSIQRRSDTNHIRDNSTISILCRWSTWSIISVTPLFLVVGLLGSSDSLMVVILLIILIPSVSPASGPLWLSSMVTVAKHVSRTWPRLIPTHVCTPTQHDHTCHQSWHVVDTCILLHQHDQLCQLEHQTRVKWVGVTQRDHFQTEQGGRQTGNTRVSRKQVWIHVWDNFCQQYMGQTRCYYSCHHCLDKFDATKFGFQGLSLHIERDEIDAKMNNWKMIQWRCQDCFNRIYLDVPDFQSWTTCQWSEVRNKTKEQTRLQEA